MTFGDAPKLNLNEKIYRIRKERRCKETIIEGTLEYLINYFGYTLEVGHSYNPKIERYPKTIKSFMTNLKNALNKKEEAIYERTYVDLL